MLNISKKLTSLVGKTNAKYNLLEKNDKVLVGFSGGKDSLTLIHILNRIKNIAPYKFEFEAVTVSYGMGENLKFLQDHCAKHKIKHHIIDTKIFDISKQKIRKNSSFCSFVSRMRRGHLYSYALKHNFNKIALGHHLDDAVESFFMNIFYNGAMRTMPPIYKAKNGLQVIRPLIFCRERQLDGFAKEHKIETISDENCPAFRVDIKMPHTREKTKKLLHELQLQNPKLFTTIKASFENIHIDTFF
ncbi:MAG: tRNA 2-thiocytidine(32) synthetase TtcA [Campylobacteraceae bacterium 4484_166]|nr:MAG: tRNA 2-thiocytidine(32) synthetase TtcA [Campylobacteraceae bacterium 4484_166]